MKTVKKKSYLPPPLFRCHLRDDARPREEGSILIAVMIVMIFLAAGLGTYLNSLSNIEHLQDQRVMEDRALMAAEAGLARAVVDLQGMQGSGLPTSDQVWPQPLTVTDFAPFQAVVVNVYPRPIGGHPTSWTLASTATSASDARTHPFSRRVQTTLFQENFAKYEYFVNDFGDVWGPGNSYTFEGFGSVFLGPYHANSGAAFWPNLWFVNDATTGAKGDPNKPEDPVVRYYTNFNAYKAIYGKSEAKNYVNVLQSFNSTFNNAPQFYHGLNVLPDPISMPANMTSTSESRTTELRDNAGLKLPQDYKEYDPSKGPNFVIELEKSDGGQVKVKQYLGLKDGKPDYGKEKSYNIKDINNAMIVYGNIKSFEGTLDGKLTVGAFRKPPPQPGVPNPDPEPNDPGGSVDITGDLNYASRPDDLSYTDAPGLYTKDGKGINQDYVSTLLDQLDKVTDVLGIVSEGDVMIKEKDLRGDPVAADVNKPMHLDAIVMATGSATSNTNDGGFGVENYATRPKGAALTIGGQIQNYGYVWAHYNNSGFDHGLLQTRLWDQRAYKPGGAPPFFPTTGNLQPIPQSWRSNYVENAAIIPWFPQ